MVKSGLRLEIGDGPALAEIGAVNAALAPYGAGVWPLELGRAPPGIRALLARPTLTEDEAGRIEAAFLLSRADACSTPWRGPGARRTCRAAGRLRPRS